MANAFDFEIDMHGARVVAARLPLMPACRRYLLNSVLKRALLCGGNGGI
jgi:hypothetical protein